MNQDSLSFTLSQINQLVSNLSKKNYVQSVRQVAGVSEKKLYRCRLDRCFRHHYIEIERNNTVQDRAKI